MIERVRSLLRKRYIKRLVRRGLVLGKAVELNDGFFLDPSHCFLITIEDGVVFGPGVRLFAHDASSLKCLGKTKIGLVRIRKNCFIGAGTVILPGVTIGENSIVGANSTVTRNIPANDVWGGNPATRLLSVQDYVSMLRMRSAPEFSEEAYNIGVIAAEGKREMIDVLSKKRVGFMVP